MEGGAEREAEAVGPHPAPDPAVAPAREKQVWILLLLVLAGAALVRWRLLDAPLERDEGEYAYIGRLMLRGEPPYRSAYNMKLPGIYAAYALVMGIFGETVRGIHQGLLVANLLSSVLVFLLGRRLLGAWAGLVAATVFAALSVSEGVQGPFANAEHFVLVPALAGLFLLARGLARDGRRASLELGLAGACFGLAFVVKQHGLFYAVCGGLLVVLREARRRPLAPRASLARLALFGAGVALPYAALCAWMALAGVFESFWFWTFTYAREYAGVRPWSEFAKNLRSQGAYVTRVAPFLWVLAALGLTALFWDPRARRHAAFLLVLVACCFLSITPGFHFRPHYFVLGLPAVALLAGAFVTGLGRRLVPRTGRVLGVSLAALVLALAMGDFLRRQGRYLFELPPALVSRQTFGFNPFPEALPVANYVREATEPEDRVAILGSEPEIWFYADRRAASGYVYIYALMEPQPFALQMQRDMIRQLEESRAEVLILVRVKTSWLASKDSHPDLLTWLAQELREYDLEALMPVAIGSRLVRGPALEELGDARPTEDVVEIYRRKR